MSGFHDILPPRWVYNLAHTPHTHTHTHTHTKHTQTGLFNRNELQQLVSGMSASFDILDLQKHCKYLGGYSPTHGVMKNLWKILEEFSDAEKAAFLAFVTSSSKPPLLGFAHLHPPFCIRLADDPSQGGFFGSINRLPSASTCFNLLKVRLPHTRIGFRTESHPTFLPTHVNTIQYSFRLTRPKRS